MRVTSIQVEMKDRSKEENLANVLNLMDRAGSCDLILLPEIWPCGFFRFDRYRAESEPLDGLIMSALKKRAVDLKCHVMTGSIVERDGRDLFNTTLLLNSEGEIIARYRKVHLFGYQSGEKELLKGGDEVVVAPTPWGPAGLSICYDLRFPEFYRKMVDAGAAIFLVASAWPHARLETWTLFNRARAIENLAYVFSCNCAGANKGQQYAGHSMIVDPMGNIIAEGGDGECFVSAEIDPNLVDSVRKEFPALKDRVF